jgi:hypothetical protein
MQPPQRITYGPMLLAVLVWLFAGSEIYQRADIDLNGIIVSADTSCMQPYNNRCGTIYVVKSRDGSRHTYIAGPTDQALPRRLPVGTVVVKDKWALSYSLNGREIRDFPIIFYSGLLVLGLISAIWWYALFRHNRTSLSRRE